MKTNGKVSSKDLGTIAALLYTGIKPIEFRYVNGTLFAEFEDTAEVKDSLHRYMCDELRVAPRAFLGLIRNLKSMAFNGTTVTTRRR